MEVCMIQVSEILKLSLFSNFKILCGKEYLSNEVSTAVVLEYESSRIHYSGYGPGYFPLVSYFFAKTNPDLVLGTLRNLIEKKVSAIAIKISPEEFIPADIIHLAIENHVPLLTFYDEFMEDLIININESMKTRSQYIVYEQKLNQILNGNPSPEEVEKIAYEINPDFCQNILSANIITKEESTNLQVHTFFDNLMYRKYQTNGPTTYKFVKNGHNLMLIFSFQDKKGEDFSAYEYVKKIISSAGFVPDSFYIGICEEFMPVYKLNYSVKKAQCAAIIAKYQNKNCLLYKDLGIYRYAVSLVQNRMLNEEIDHQIQILKAYDQKHESYLLRTLISLVKNNFDYVKASEECYQHTNTIRYRLKKTIELLSIQEDTAQEELSLLIRCYLLREIFVTKHIESGSQ